MSTRTFHLGDVLSVTTGRLVSRRHVDALYDLLNFMTGDNLFTHQLPRAMEECAPRILEQHPQLREVQVPAKFGGQADVFAWLDEQVARFGEELAVAPLAGQDHTRIDPITELIQMRGSTDGIVVVETGGES